MGATGNVFGNYQVGTLIKFSNAGTTVWASIVSVLDNGYYVLSTSVSSNMQAQEYILQYRTRFNSVEVQAIAAMLDKKTDFVIIHDKETTSWIPLEISTDEDTISYNGNEVLVMINIKYTAETWEFDANGVEYVFVGGDKVRFTSFLLKR
ncbi:UNVERIFIED_ORG: hypothetical protein [Escherichia phage CMSTMSU]